MDAEDDAPEKNGMDYDLTTTRFDDVIKGSEVEHEREEREDNPLPPKISRTTSPNDEEGSGLQ